MIYYIHNMLEDFSVNVKPQSTAPWNDKSFKVSPSVKSLDDEKKAEFHTFVMKAMFLCKEPGLI